MNFYTLTSKKLKRLILLFFISAFAILAGLDILLEVYASSKTTPKTFITEKESKIKHCELNQPFNKDTIFIGSSRTFYHISTNEFKKNGVNIYNLGVSNNALEDYASFVNEAIKYNPKLIVISIEVNELFRPLPLSKYPTIADIEAYLSSMDISYKFQAIVNWIKNIHTLLRHSETIYLKIKSFYQKYNPSIFLDNQKEITSSKQTLDYYSLADCYIFSLKYTANDFITSKCENGDGILFGHNHKEYSKKTLNLKKVNHETIHFINNIIEQIKEKEITPIIILEPVFLDTYNYKYNFENIRKEIHSKVIDLTHLNIESKLWIDNRHLNNEGRLFYSQYLSKILKKEIE